MYGIQTITTDRFRIKLQNENPSDSVKINYIELDIKFSVRYLFSTVDTRLSKYFFI